MNIQGTCCGCRQPFPFVELKNNAICKACFTALQLGKSIHHTLEEALRPSLVDVYFCIRVWEAWGYGTMGPQDFEQVNCDRVADEMLDQLKEKAIEEVARVW